MTLAKHPLMNAAYEQDAIKYNPDVNVAMAVAMPDGGLITPTLQKADQTDLYSLSRSWKVPGLDGAHQPWASWDPHPHQPWAPCNPHAHQPWASCDPCL